jgi:hypothetical protein
VEDAHGLRNPETREVACGRGKTVGSTNRLVWLRRPLRSPLGAQKGRGLRAPPLSRYLEPCFLCYSVPSESRDACGRDPRRSATDPASRNAIIAAISQGVLSSAPVKAVPPVFVVVMPPTVGGVVVSVVGKTVGGVVVGGAVVVGGGVVVVGGGVVVVGGGVVVVVVVSPKQKEM